MPTTPPVRPSAASSRSLADERQRKGQKVIEYRAFDAPGGPTLLKAVLAVFSGLLLDQQLSGRTQVQDPERIRKSCLEGFADAEFRDEGQQLLDATARVLPQHHDSVNVLQQMLDGNDSYAARLKARYSESGSIMSSISGQFEY